MLGEQIVYTPDPFFSAVPWTGMIVFIDRACNWMNGDMVRIHVFPPFRHGPSTIWARFSRVPAPETWRFKT